MVQQKLGIIYVELNHITMIQTLKKLNHKIGMIISMYDHQLYTSVLY